MAKRTHNQVLKNDFERFELIVSNPKNRLFKAWGGQDRDNRELTLNVVEKIYLLGSTVDVSALSKEEKPVFEYSMKRLSSMANNQDKLINTTQNLQPGSSQAAMAVLQVIKRQEIEYPKVFEIGKQGIQNRLEKANDFVSQYKEGDDVSAYRDELVETMQIIKSHQVLLERNQEVVSNNPDAKKAYQTLNNTMSYQDSSKYMQTCLKMYNTSFANENPVVPKKPSQYRFKTFDEVIANHQKPKTAMSTVKSIIPSESPQPNEIDQDIQYLMDCLVQADGHQDISAAEAFYLTTKAPSAPEYALLSIQRGFEKAASKVDPHTAQILLDMKESFSEYLQYSNNQNSKEAFQNHYESLDTEHLESALSKQDNNNSYQP